MENKTHTIYCLRDPKTKKVKYVGCTSRPIEERLRDHISNRNNSEGTEKDKWISKLKDRGLSPLIRVLDSATGSDAKDREIYWIQHYLEIGAPLLNIHHNPKCVACSDVNTIAFRVDKITSAKLEALASELNLSKSAIIRRGIDLLYDQRRGN